MTDLGFNTDFPLHFRENHTQVYSFPLAAESKITYLCIQKLRKECNLLEMSIG